VISAAVREGLAGLEELVGIPGTLGGALHGNSGTQNRDIGQGTSSATMLTRDGKLVTKQRNDLTFAYHYSSLDELVILEATFDLEPGDSRVLTQRMQQQWIMQRAVQPLADQNTARMFKDPPGSTAAELIEQAGLKSARQGDVELSSRNANFVIAGAKASSDDVVALLEELRRKVRERTGVELELALDIW
jgi:UDP-N-acetylmuramate dehydrogenase